MMRLSDEEYLKLKEQEKKEIEKLKEKKRNDELKKLSFTREELQDIRKRAIVQQQLLIDSVKQKAYKDIGDACDILDAVFARDELDKNINEKDK